MANDFKTDPKTSALDANWRTTGWTVLASVCGVGFFAVHAFLLPVLLLAGAGYCGFQAYKAKQEERTALMNIIAPQNSSRSSADIVPEQQLAPEPSASVPPIPAKNWQATVSTPPAPGAGRNI